MTSHKIKIRLNSEKKWHFPRIRDQRLKFKNIKQSSFATFYAGYLFAALVFTYVKTTKWYLIQGELLIIKQFSKRDRGNLL